MTKKHFVELAQLVRDCKPQEHNGVRGTANSGQIYQWETMRDALASFCASQNPRFNRERWLAYINGECGPNGGTIKGGK
jgi:hypothetical protein